MALTLRVTSYNNNAPAKTLSVTVNESGCTIGRATDNDFVLPDVERIISHRHATIQFENGVWYLTDNSTNGTFINHAAEPVGQGARVQLHNGDILSIGKYDCTVTTEIQQKAGTDSILSDALLHPPYHQVVEKSAREKEPYREPVVTAPSSPSGAAPALAVGESFFSPPEAIPEDWDELTGFSKKKPVQAAPVISEPIPANPKPQQQPGYKQPSHKQHAVKMAPEPPVTARSITNTDQQAVNAFLAGAGLTHTTLKPEEVISFMNTAGQLMREITQGFRQALDTRTSVKSEFRLGMTTIRSTKNNPLKFSIDVDDALTKLLRPPSRGYLPPVEAIQEATDDLQAHQMAILAGLRAALASLVTRFDPEQLERELHKASVVDNLLPFIRKARFWEVFKTRYKKAAADAENDFLHFLGDEFAIAYEQQIQRLKKARQKQ